MKTVQHDLIKLRAYEIWELRGYPHGLDKKHWEQAEKELLDAAPEVEASVAAAPRRGEYCRTVIRGVTTPIGALDR